MEDWLCGALCVGVPGPWGHTGDWGSFPLEQVGVLLLPPLPAPMLPGSFSRVPLGEGMVLPQSTGP